jgi:hypothetical protein
MAERLEGVKTLRPPHRHYKPSDGAGQDEVDEGQDEEPAALPLVA